MVHAALRQAGLWDGDAALGPGAVRGDTLLLGAGAACTTPAQLAVHGAIWESALRAINGLLTGLRIDDTDFTADDPPTRAALLLRRLITVDYHAAITRSGHPYDRSPSATSPTNGAGSSARRAAQSSACFEGSTQRPSG